MRSWTGLTAALVATLAIGCTPVDPRPSVKFDPRQAEAVTAEVSFLVAALTEGQPAVPTPVNPSPGGDICENCNGRGKVGDSRVMFDCDPCGGTGRIVRASSDSPADPAGDDAPFEAGDESDTESEQPASQSQRTGYRTVTDSVTGVTTDRPTIVMITRPNCPPCDLWWSTDRPAYVRNGWDVPDPVDASTTSPATGPTPSFRVFTGQEWRGFDGFMNFGDCRRLLSGGADAATAANSASSAKTSARLANGPRRYAHTWSWPASDGGIADHLMKQSRHGLSREALVGKSQRELEELHSKIHLGLETSAGFRQSSCPDCATVRRGR